MTRALLHIGLAAATVFAPVLCCCKAGVFHPTTGAAALAPSPADRAPTDSCCRKAPGLGAKSCCHEQPEPPRPTSPADDHSKRPPAPDGCACCNERPDAAQTESKPTVSPAEPTGERLPLAGAPHAAGSPEHLGRFRGLPPPGRVGVDARFAALYERHVLRC